jgi:hypothetical protein
VICCARQVQGKCERDVVLEMMKMDTARTWAARRRTWRTPIIVSSCLVTSTSTPTGGRYCTQSQPGLARQHRAAASQISLCRVLSLFVYCTRPRPSPALPNAVTRGREGLGGTRGECCCVRFMVIQCRTLPFSNQRWSSASCSSSAYSRCTYAGYERKDSGERE